MEINTKAIEALLAGLTLGGIFGGFAAKLLEINASKNLTYTPPLLTAVVCGLTAYLLTKSFSSISACYLTDDPNSRVTRLQICKLEAVSLSAFLGGVLAACAVNLLSL